jgi:hypothetical protein
LVSNKAENAVTLKSSGFESWAASIDTRFRPCERSKEITRSWLEWLADRALLLRKAIGKLDGVAEANKEHMSNMQLSHGLRQQVASRPDCRHPLVASRPDCRHPLRKRCIAPGE